MPKSEEEGTDKIRNLLVIGRTGSGKSALANVLSGTEEFEESGYSVSKTEDYQEKDFIWNGNKYCVVDTVGIGSTKLSGIEEVLDKINEGINSMEGISQILLVIDKVSAIDEKVFKLLEKNVGSKYITIIRNRFSNFKNEDECETDKKKLREKNGTIAKIVDLNHIVHVDNPSLNIISDGDVDVENLINYYKKRRTDSRKILLEYLDKVCPKKYHKFKTNMLDKLRIGIKLKSNRK